jgi:hypothetical protein
MKITKKSRGIMKVNHCNHLHHSLVFVLGSVMILSLLSLAFVLTRPSLSEAQSGLPSRETPTPTPPPSKDKKQGNDQPLGAYIELQAQPVPPGAWSVVQWQDPAGNWRDVDGWQGTLTATGFIRWWVAAKDFNTGPFRWLVKSGPTGPVLGVSEPFSLPSGPHQTVRVLISVWS